jgi:hypothetical protein
MSPCSCHSSYVDRTPTRKSFARTHDDCAAYLISTPSQSDPESIRAETRTPPVSISPTLPLIPVLEKESDEHLRGLETEVRCARGQREHIEGSACEKFERELLSDGDSIKRTAAAEHDKEGGDSETEPESEGDVFRVLQSIKRRKERDGRHSDEVPRNVHHRHSRSFNRRVQAIVERLDGDSSLDSDDYERAGAALSIPPSDDWSLPSDLSITESFIETLPEPVKAFVEMFETESLDVGSS